MLDIETESSIITLKREIHLCLKEFVPIQEEPILKKEIKLIWEEELNERQLSVIIVRKYFRRIKRQRENIVLEIVLLKLILIPKNGKK